MLLSGDPVPIFSDLVFGAPEEFLVLGNIAVAVEFLNATSIPAGVFSVVVPIILRIMKGTLFASPQLFCYVLLSLAFLLLCEPLLSGALSSGRGLVFLTYSFSFCCGSGSSGLLCCFCFLFFGLSLQLSHLSLEGSELVRGIGAS